MRTIILHEATLRNNGRYIDAGSAIVVGTTPDAIDATRAARLVKRRAAARLRP